MKQTTMQSKARFMQPCLIRQSIAVGYVRAAARKEAPKRVNGKKLSPKQRLAKMDEWNRKLQKEHENKEKRERVRELQLAKDEDYQLAIAV